VNDRSREEQEDGMKNVSRGALRAVPIRKTALFVADWLCLAAAPTFAAMAIVTGLAEAGHPDMLCSPAGPLSRSSGMVPMYLLMSAFHSPPWVNWILGRRNEACRA
jgi:hypothetical protein